VLARQPYGYVGLVQAYFLMFLLALVCLIGATRWPSRLSNVALLIHVPLILLEAFALLRKAPFLRHAAPAQ
jgi:hypothetical protein